MQTDERLAPWAERHAPDAAALVAGCAGAQAPCRPVGRKKRLRCVGLAGALLGVAGPVAAEVVAGPFSAAAPGAALPPGWALVGLPGVAATRFGLVDDRGTTVLRLEAEGSAASLHRPLRIDPSSTPILRWRWRTANLISGGDLRTKEGDDLPVRLYVMFDYPLDRLSLIERGKILLARSVAGELVPAAALCYVWDGKLPAGTTLWNAYSERVRVIVAESGSKRLGQWVAEERDVAADFRAAFGEDAPPISGIAVAADTDQTGETALSWFGDISFSER